MGDGRNWSCIAGRKRERRDRKKEERVERRDRRRERGLEGWTQGDLLALHWASGCALGPVALPFEPETVESKT